MGFGHPCAGNAHQVYQTSPHITRTTAFSPYLQVGYLSSMTRNTRLGLDFLMSLLAAGPEESGKSLPPKRPREPLPRISHQRSLSDGQAPPLPPRPLKSDAKRQQAFEKVPSFSENDIQEAIARSNADSELFGVSPTSRRSSRPALKVRHLAALRALCTQPRPS